MGKNQKDVKPITARQVGELARLLEERGMGSDIFQSTLIENIKGVIFISRGKLGFFIGKTIQVKEDCGYIFETEICGDNQVIVGVARNTYDYAMGNIIRVGDNVISNGRKIFIPEGTKGKITEIREPDFWEDNMLSVVFGNFCNKVNLNDLI